MYLSNIFSLGWWNRLTISHMSDVIMVLTAVILVLADLPVRRTVNRIYKPKSAVLRFAVLVAVCSFGFAALAVVTAKILRVVILLNGGHFAALIAIGILIVTGIGAAGQKLI